MAIKIARIQKIGRIQIFAIAAVSLLGMLAACNVQRCSEGAVCQASNSSGPSAVASPSPAASATPTATPTPSPTPDPCLILGIQASGSTQVRTGELVRFDITPVGPAGPQEGPLDRCNTIRFVTPENVANLTCSGSCSGFVQYWKAGAVGRFSIRFRVDGAVSAPFEGEIVK